MAINENMIPKKIIIDEGEFAITDTATPLATWGVNQCVVIYIHTTAKHALAHVDTRTEKSSLDLMFNNVQITHPYKIELVGARGDNSILDSPQINKKKIEDYLINKQLEYAWIGPWNSMIAYGKELHEGNYLRFSEVLPTCSGRQLMLLGPFYGTLPLAETESIKKPFTYLNQRLTYQLLNERKTIDRISNPILKESCREYSKNLIEKRDFIIKHIQNMYPAVDYINKMLLTVPDESLTLNADLISSLNTEQWWRNNKFVNGENSRNTVNLLLESLKSLLTKQKNLETFPKECIENSVIKILQNKNFNFATELQFNLFDTFTSLSDIVKSIKECSPHFWSLLIINNVGDTKFGYEEVTKNGFINIAQCAFKSRITAAKLACFINEYNDLQQKNVLKNLNEEFKQLLKESFSKVTRQDKRGFIKFEKEINCFDKQCIEINISQVQSISLKNTLKNIFDQTLEKIQKKLASSLIDNNLKLNSFVGPGILLYQYLAQLENFEGIGPISWINDLTKANYINTENNNICNNLEYTAVCKKCNDQTYTFVPEENYISIPIFYHAYVLFDDFLFGSTCDISGLIFPVTNTYTYDKIEINCDDEPNGKCSKCNAFLDLAKNGNLQQYKLNCKDGIESIPPLKGKFRDTTKDTIFKSIAFSYLTTFGISKKNKVCNEFKSNYMKDWVKSGKSLEDQEGMLIEKLDNLLKNYLKTKYGPIQTRCWKPTSDTPVCNEPIPEDDYGDVICLCESPTDQVYGESVQFIDGKNRLSPIYLGDWFKSHTGEVRPPTNMNGIPDRDIFETYTQVWSHELAHAQLGLYDETTFQTHPEKEITISDRLSVKVYSEPTCAVLHQVEAIRATHQDLLNADYEAWQYAKVYGCLISICSTVIDLGV